MSCVNNGAGVFACGEDKGGGTIAIKARFPIAGFGNPLQQIVSDHPAAKMICTVYTDGARAKLGGCK